MKNITFSRSDLVAAQDIYGTLTAYQLEQGTQPSSKSRDADKIPLHESVDQKLQADLFFFLGQVFLLSISVMLGLIMITHLGAGSDKTVNTSRQADGSRAEAGQALIQHVHQYLSKGFRVTLVTSDGEGAFKTIRKDIEQLGAELNTLGHGTHAPHAEAAIRHIKNKAV